MSDWVILLVFIAAIYGVYVAIYSILALLFSWPTFHTGDWKEMGFVLALQAVIGIPALLLLDKYFPALPGLRRVLFVVVLGMFIARVVGPKSTSRTT